MNLTPLGALEILLFEAQIANTPTDADNLIGRVQDCGKALGLTPPSLEQYDNLRLALRDARTRKARLS